MVLIVIIFKIWYVKLNNFGMYVFVVFCFILKYIFVLVYLLYICCFL